MEDLGVMKTPEEKFLEGFFWEKFLLEDFLGGIFWEEFFWEEFLVYFVKVFEYEMD